MLPPDILLAFTLAAFLLALAPGPDNIFVLTQSALNGAKSGIFVVFGLCTGLLVHSAAVALGVAALIKASALAFTALKLAGAAYLVYLAYQAFRAPATGLDASAPRLSPGALYRRGLIMNITNPKVAIFFLALFPQFTDPERGAMILQIAQLGAIFMVVTLIVFSIVALIAGSLSAWLKSSPSAQGIMNKIAGVVFIGLAAKIAVSER
ncbi:MAG: LysE family translocator [Pseudomonadota bacterium]